MRCQAATSTRAGSGPWSTASVHDTGATQIADLDYTLQATSYDDLQTKFNQRVADKQRQDLTIPRRILLAVVNTTKPGEPPHSARTVSTLGWRRMHRARVLSRSTPST